MSEWGIECSESTVRRYLLHRFPSPMRLVIPREAFRLLMSDQLAETFLHCHQLAFEAWGGEPRTVRPDNRKGP